MELIKESEVNKLSFRKPGKRYLLYQKAIKSHIKDIDNKIKNSENGIHKIKEEEIRDILGEHLKDNGTEIIRQALKYIFWKYDIVVETRPRVSGKKNFYFRKRVKSDTTIAEPE